MNLQEEIDSIEKKETFLDRGQAIIKTLDLVLDMFVRKELWTAGEIREVLQSLRRAHLISMDIVNTEGSVDSLLPRNCMCGGDPEVVKESYFHFECQRCGLKTPECKTYESALSCWNGKG